MGRLLTTGYESGHIQSEGPGLTSQGTSSITSAAARTGGFGYRTTAVGAFSIFSFTGATQRSYFVRAYIRKGAVNPTVATALLTFRTAAPANTAYVVLRADGALNIRNAANADVAGTTTSVLTADQWYRLELEVRVGTSTTTGRIVLRLDGTTLYTGTAENCGTVAPAQLVIGQNGGTTSATVDFDDVALNDDQGTIQTDFPDEGAVRHLHPASTVAVGTGWQKPGGATTDLHTAVDNTPPVYAADSTLVTAAESFVRNADAGGNRDLDLGLQSYTAAGVPSGEIITLIQPRIGTGSNNATDTAGGLQLVSNPAGSMEAFAAFDNGVASTTATTWPTRRGSYVFAPSVTRGTAPTLRVRKTTAISRSANVNYAALMVESAPVTGAVQDLAGAVAILTTTDGALTAVIPLASQSALLTEASGELTIVTPLAGQSALAIGVDGVLALDAPLSGQTDTVIIPTGALGNMHGVAGTAALVIGAQGELVAEIPLAGSASLLTDVSGELDVEVIRELEGDASVSVSAVGDLGVDLPLTGEIPTVIGAAGDLEVDVTLSGGADTALGASGTLSAFVNADGEVSLVIGAAGEPEYSIGFTGASDVALLPIGSLSIEGAVEPVDLVGSGQLILTADGELERFAGFGADGVVRVVSAGALTLERVLFGQAALHFAGVADLRLLWSYGPYFGWTYPERGGSTYPPPGITTYASGTTWTYEGD